MSSRTESEPRIVDLTELYDEPSPWPRRIVWALVVIGILLALDTVWTVLSVRGQMERAEGALGRGADGLLEGNVDEAGTSFQDAAAAAGDTRSFLHHPAALLASVTPFISDDVRAVHHLVDAASLAADAGTTLTGAARRVGWQGGSLSGLSAGDTSLASTLSAAGGEIRSAAGQLESASTILTDTPTVGLTGPVRKAVLAGRDQVVKRADLLSSARDLANVVPSLFQDGRRYLLVVQNPNQPRGTGGYMGYMGFLHSVNGDLTLDRFFRTPTELAKVPVKAPEDYSKRYERYGALVDMRQSNLSPDLPTSANVTLELARDLGWGEFDGIFMVDPIWMKYMLEATGPVDTPGWPQAITADNVVQVLGRDVFTLDQNSASDRAQDLIGTAVWNAVQTRNVPGTAMGEALARAAAERHLQVYSIHPDEEATLGRLNVTGRAALGKNPLSVVYEARSDNKVGYFIDRKMDVDVTLDDRGNATVTTTVRMKNGAPDGPPSRLLGEGTDVPVGTWSSLISAYMPERVSGHPTFLPRGGNSGTMQEFGHQVGFGEVTIPSKGTAEWSVTYEAPDAVTYVEGASEYRLTFLPQPSLSPIPITVRIHLPDDHSVTSTSTGMQTNGTTATYEDSPTTPEEIWVRFA